MNIMENIHATCVEIDGLGVMLRGVPGSGKSDLALRLIDEGARLVSDDYAHVENSDGKLVATAPDSIRGLIEVRGIGVIRLDHVVRVNLALLVDLVEADQIERLPDQGHEPILGVDLRRITLFPFEPSATAKVRIALKVATGNIIQET